MRQRINAAPTYMDREDLARCVDQFKLDPWMVKIINGMRDALNNIEYELREQSGRTTSEVPNA